MVGALALPSALSFSLYVSPSPFPSVPLPPCLVLYLSPVLRVSPWNSFEQFTRHRLLPEAASKQRIHGDVKRFIVGPANSWQGTDEPRTTAAAGTKGAVRERYNFGPTYLGNLHFINGQTCLRGGRRRLSGRQVNAEWTPENERLPTQALDRTDKRPGMTICLDRGGTCRDEDVCWTESADEDEGFRARRCTWTLAT